MKIKNSNVLITGGASGIGKIMGRMALEKGAKCVIIWDINEQNIAATVKELSTKGKVNGYRVDVGNIEAVSAAYATTVKECGDIDILINNAGTQNEGDIDTNLKALIRITEKYGIQKSIRSILNIGSASGHTGAEFPEYCASKGGVIAYTKNVALRVAAMGATCNSLDPGGVLTPLNDCVVNDPALWSEIMEQTPLKKWATVEEIARWAYFLTVENSFCTGQSIVVDGGESINSHFVWPE